MMDEPDMDSAPELLTACTRAQREPALALLDLDPALLSAAWAGDGFDVDNNN